MSLWDLVDLQEYGQIPSNWRFRLQGGRTLYDEVGSGWRERSNDFTFLRRSDLNKERFLASDTPIEILRIDDTKKQ